MNLQRVGLIVNPLAGMGGLRNISAALAVLEALRPRHVITGPGQLGEDAVPVGPTKPESISLVDPLAEVDSASGRWVTQRIASETARLGADALVVVGGDGTLADAATALHAGGSQLPILGIGAGSTNAGGLVTLRSNELERLAGAELSVQSVTALELRLPDGDTVLAFNDVVVGNTICGTLDGRFVDLGAEAFMRGERAQATPEPISCPSAKVTKRRAGDAGAELQVSEGLAVGSVAIGFTRTGDVMGQALLGGLGLSSAAGIPAACLVTSLPVVYAGVSPEAHAEMEPLDSSYVGLSEGEAIVLEGFGAGAVLCADGNPLRGLRIRDRAEVRVVQDACRVVRLSRGQS